MKLWSSFLNKLDSQFGKQTIDKWVRSLDITKYDAANLYLQAQDSFQLMWFNEHIKPIVEKSLVNNNGRIIKVHISVGVKTKPVETVKKEEDLSVNYTSDELTPYCSFEQYVPSNENELPFQILQKLTSSKQDELSYNPIFLYGPSGCGKTHLLTACAKACMQNGLKTIFVSSQTFTNHVVSAIRKGDMQTFRKHYRHLDVLIIDDVQLFARKNATQEELFHTFNTLHTANKQIILSSNLTPSFLEGIEERLVSRFEWGITLPIKKVNHHQSMVSIIQKRCSFYEIKMERSLEEYLASSYSDIKYLIKALDALIVHVQLEYTNESTIYLSMVKDFIDESKANIQKERITAEKILKMVADLFEIKTEDILSKSQSRDCALPRQIVMYLLRNELKMPYMKIGQFFSRDHSTVMSSVKVIAKSLNKKDQEISFYLQDIQRRLLSCG